MSACDRWRRVHRRIISGPCESIAERKQDRGEVGNVRSGAVILAADRSQERRPMLITDGRMAGDRSPDRPCEQAFLNRIADASEYGLEMHIHEQNPPCEERCIQEADER